MAQSRYLDKTVHLKDLNFILFAEDQFKHTNIVTLKPQQIANFGVKFCPTKEGRYERIIKLHIVNNPYEIFIVRHLIPIVFLHFNCLQISL